MTILIGVVLCVVNLGWVVVTLLTLPGTWGLLVTTALVAWWRWDERMFHPATLGVALAMAGEVLETFGGSAAVKKAGGGRWAGFLSLLGAIVGAVLGVAIPIPLVGSLIGACIGAFVGAWGATLLGGRPSTEGHRVGWAAAKGRLWGTLYKVLVGVVMWGVATVASFWP